MAQQDKKPWVKITFMEAVGQPQVTGQLLDETPDAYALQNEILIVPHPDGSAERKAVPTNLRFYQKHAVFCMEITEIKLGALTKKEVEELEEAEEL